MKSYKEQLEEVQKAISDILSGAQEAWYNGQKVKKADLNVLFTQEKYLRGKISRDPSGGGDGETGGGTSSGRRGIRVRGITPV